MKAIYVKFIDIGVFEAHLVEAEKTGSMYKMTPLDGSKFIPKRTRAYNLLPYTNILWGELKDMQFQYDELWKRRVQLSKQTFNQIPEDQKDEVSDAP